MIDASDDELNRFACSFAERLGWWCWNYKNLLVELEQRRLLGFCLSSRVPWCLYHYQMHSLLIHNDIRVMTRKCTGLLDCFVSQVHNNQHWIKSQVSVPRHSRVSRDVYLASWVYLVVFVYKTQLACLCAIIPPAADDFNHTTSHELIQVSVIDHLLLLNHVSQCSISPYISTYVILNLYPLGSSTIC